MTKILLLSRHDRLGSSSRLRSYQYLPYLAANGFEITVAPLLGNDYLTNLYAGKRRFSPGFVVDHIRRLKWLLTCRSFDLLWIEAELFPWLPGWIEELLHKLRIPYVVDYDDAVFHRYDLHGKFLVRFLLGKKIDRVMHGASMVIAGNEYLAERARGAGAAVVEVLPTVIDLERYPVAAQPDNDRYSIGWIGSPPTSKYLHWLQPALAEFCRDGKSRLIAIGSGSLELDGVPTQVLPWSEESEAAGIRRFDTGIMPLMDGTIERGKCGYKLIQYMACGRPVVASPIGVNSRIVEHGTSGFLAADNAEWIHYLRMLQQDPALRKQMGSEGRARVEQEYCLQVTAPRLASLLNRAAVMQPDSVFSL